MRFLMTEENGCLVVITRDGHHRTIYNLVNHRLVTEPAFSLLFTAKSLEEAVKYYKIYDIRFNKTTEWVKEQMALCVLGS